MANKKIIPPMPFDATAWLSNNAAMRLSFACKGLWLDMLCCMWVSIERGVMLKPIGGAYTVDELEALYGSGTKELIESLINAELLSVRHDGALYNADMVKMESIRINRLLIYVRHLQECRSERSLQKDWALVPSQRLVLLP
jgi:hypothetical protein